MYDAGRFGQITLKSSVLDFKDCELNVVNYILGTAEN